MDSHQHGCGHDHHEASTAASTCGGAGPCGTSDCGSEAGGCAHALAMPTTDERVTIPANDLATLLDLVEAFAGSSYDEDGAYSRSNEAFRAQAPALVAAREALLEQIRQMASGAFQNPQ